MASTETANMARKNLERSAQRWGVKTDRPDVSKGIAVADDTPAVAVAG